MGILRVSDSVAASLELAVRELTEELRQTRGMWEAYFDQVMVSSPEGVDSLLNLMKASRGA